MDLSIYLFEMRANNELLFRMWVSNSLSDGIILKSTAASYLGSTHDERALEHLERLLGDEHQLVRKSAADALGEFGGKRAESALEKARESEKDDRVLERIERSLKRIQEKKCVEYNPDAARRLGKKLHKKKRISLTKQRRIKN